MRLDRFLAGALAGRDEGPSRSELQRWIEHGGVQVDGVVKKAADKVREGARVDVQPEAPPPTDAIAEEGIAFGIVHQDEAIIVIDKPAGLVVHPAKGNATGTLVNGLLARGAFDVPDGDEDVDPAAPPGDIERSRPGIVHRLDKGTSGLMVVARTPRAREHLKRQFADHSIDREYVALCLGDVKAQTFDTMHGRHPTDRLRFTSRVKLGKRAVTHVRPLETLARGAVTLVACRLETGRTHQIRVHLSDHGTPILGDALYGGAKPKHQILREAAEALGRPALHARLLGFEHPLTGKRVLFEVDPPADFELVLTELRAIP
ncbi:MAG: Ribosomal large subunit pseudouridine synthase [Labilithrix sp.]|nr:Ribosomal large subunit pseudouridine synthase [Labilithrix sp.]